MQLQVTAVIGIVRFWLPIIFRIGISYDDKATKNKLIPIQNMVYRYWLLVAVFVSLDDIYPSMANIM